MRKQSAPEPLSASIREHLESLSAEEVAEACIDPEQQTARLRERFAIDREEAERQLQGWLATTDLNAG